MAYQGEWRVHILKVGTGRRSRDELQFESAGHPLTECPFSEERAFLKIGVLTDVDEAHPHNGYSLQSKPVD